MPSPTPAQLWTQAREAEASLRWSEAADLYNRGLKVFKPRPFSNLDARLVALRTSSRDECAAMARAVSR